MGQKHKTKVPSYRDEAETVIYKRSFLIGCLLGDASSRMRNPKGGLLTTEFTIAHSLQQRDLVEWKAEHFTRMFGIKPNVRIQEKQNRAIFSVTKSRRIRVIHTWFHAGRNGKKKITPKIRFMNHPVGLAMLLCDDGSIRKRKQIRKDGSIHYLPPSITIATHCFPSEQVEILLAHIESLCGAKGYINPERRIRREQKVEYARINFNSAESLKLWTYVRGYIPQVPSMMKKFAFIIERYGID